MRLKLVIAYDGRAFRGWQSQAGGGAVQDHLEAAFGELAGTARVVVHGAGRTDAGVHALGQVAQADVPDGRFQPADWLRAANARLVPEVRVLRCTKAPAGFHAQWCARGKEYVYRIWNASFHHPLELGRAWFVPGEVNLATVRAGAELLTGKHDFASFAANRRQVEKGTVRTIHRFAVARRGSMITLRVTGDGFLYHMVRLLTGSLLRCAAGREPLSWLEGMLAHPGRKKTQYLAPAEGLYLARVLY